MAKTKVVTSPMKVAPIPQAGVDFQIVEREISTRDAGQVRIKVQACGVCHSDVLTKDGLWRGIQYPREAAQRLTAIASELRVYSKGRANKCAVPLQSRTAVGMNSWATIIIEYNT